VSDAYDALVIGGGPGGSATAFHLARGGARVLLAEKQTYPRDKVCGDGLTPRAVRALDHMGLGKALTDSVGAVSVGIVEGEPVLDLDYPEDSSAQVDVNVVMAGDGRLIEVQATAERAPLDRDQLDELLDLAAAGIEEIALAQQDAVEAVRA